MMGPEAFGETCNFYNFDQQTVTGGTFDAIAPVIQGWYVAGQHNLPGEPIDNGILGYPYDDRTQLHPPSQVGDELFNPNQLPVHQEDFRAFFQ